jgi:hypothetical protein
MRTTLKIIQPLIGNTAPAHVYFDRRRNSATKEGEWNDVRSTGESNSLPIYLRQ